MKVTLKGTSGEFLDLAELLTDGRAYRHAIDIPKNTAVSPRPMRNVQAGTEVPNRDREEGTW